MACWSHGSHLIKSLELGQKSDRGVHLIKNSQFSSTRRKKMFCWRWSCFSGVGKVRVGQERWQRVEKVSLIHCCACASASLSLPNQRCWCCSSDPSISITAPPPPPRPQHGGSQSWCCCCCCCQLRLVWGSQPHRWRLSRPWWDSPPRSPGDQKRLLLNWVKSSHKVFCLIYRWLIRC